MSNQDIADTLFVDEDDMATLATQNELFKLIGVEDGDPRYSDVLLIADWHTRKLKEARIDEANYIQKMFKTHLFDPTGTMGFDEHASSRSKDEIERALQYNHNHAWAAIRAAEKVNERLAELQQEEDGKS